MNELNVVNAYLMRKEAFNLEQLKKAILAGIVSLATTAGPAAAATIDLEQFQRDIDNSRNRQEAQLVLRRAEKQLRQRASNEHGAIKFEIRKVKRQAEAERKAETKRQLAQREKELEQQLKDSNILVQGILKLIHHFTKDDPANLSKVDAKEKAKLEELEMQKAFSKRETEKTKDAIHFTHWWKYGPHD
jgi:hypothetical protein